MTTLVVSTSVMVGRQYKAIADVRWANRKNWDIDAKERTKHNLLQFPFLSLLVEKKQKQNICLVTSSAGNAGRYLFFIGISV